MKRTVIFVLILVFSLTAYSQYTSWQVKTKYRTDSASGKTDTIACTFIFDQPAKSIAASCESKKMDTTFLFDSIEYDTVKGFYYYPIKNSPYKVYRAEKIVASGKKVRLLVVQNVDGKTMEFY